MCIRDRPPDRRPRLQFQAQTRAELPQGGGQGQGLRLLPRPFDRLQGAGRNPAAPLRHRPRRIRQSGGDAPARRQEDEHDARAENEKVTPGREEGPQAYTRKQRRRNGFIRVAGCCFRFYETAIPASGTSPTADLPYRLQGRGNPVAAPSVLFPIFGCGAVTALSGCRDLLPGRLRFGFGTVRSYSIAESFRYSRSAKSK